jgi:SAM-dependent methyltransferase
VDQLAMSLAIAATGAEPWRLEHRWNFPTHAPELIPPDSAAPAVLHYRRHVNAVGLLLPTDVPQVDARIETANKAVGDEWRAEFPNSSFWDWRYRTNPQLGSGIGSRGKSLEDKRALLATTIEILHPTSVLDVGCGDGEATRGLPLGSYIGLDVSAEALRHARTARPSGDFRIGSLSDNPLTADLTLCIDVLIHQSDADTYEQLVGELLASADRALLVSGYEERPSSSAPMISFHEPLSRTLTRLTTDAEIHPLREAQGITTFLVLQPERRLRE